MARTQSPAWSSSSLKIKTWARSNSLNFFQIPIYHDYACLSYRPRKLSKWAKCLDFMRGSFAEAIIRRAWELRWRQNGLLHLIKASSSVSSRPWNLFWPPSSLSSCNQTIILSSRSFIHCPTLNASPKYIWPANQIISWRANVHNQTDLSQFWENLRLGAPSLSYLSSQQDVCKWWWS